MTVVEDIASFYWGNHRPDYLVSMQTVRVGSEKNFKRALLVFWFDPELMNSSSFDGTHINPGSSMTNWSVLTEDHLEMTLSTIRRGGASRLLCCQQAIDEHGVGHGCADDIDLILQMALFEEVRYG